MYVYTVPLTLNLTTHACSNCTARHVFKNARNIFRVRTQTYDVLLLEIARVHARGVHFVGVCSLNCTHASTRAYYAQVQSSVHEKNTHALTVCTNCTRAFRHVYDSQDLPYAVHSSTFHVFHYCPCHTRVVHTIVTTLWKIIVSSILSK